MKKFKVEGLDCASCALKIENALKDIEGFDEASLNFATQTLSIPSDGIGLARETIARIEPEARIIDPHDTSQKEPGNLPAVKFIRVILSAMLLLTGIIFRDALQSTPFKSGEYVVFLSAYLLVGFPVLLHAFRSIIRGQMFDEMFLMSIATLGAVAIHELPEAVGVMLFYAVGEMVQEKAVERSRASIAELMALRPDSARLVEGEEIREVDPESVAVGALIQVRPGERVPLDGSVMKGSSSVDTSALTGESVPRMVEEGDLVLAGFVNDGGTLLIEVRSRYEESEVARILTLVEESAKRKAPTERFISKFAAVYTPIIVAISLAVAFLPPLLFSAESLSTWVYRALVILVISCPCALVISVPLGYFGGIGSASKRGILIKGASYIDMLKDLTTVVFDKTGTLTEGNFRVVRIVESTGGDGSELLTLAAAAEAHSPHPIGASIRREFRRIHGEEPIPSCEEYGEVRGFGVKADLGGKRILAGSRALLKSEGVEVPPLAENSTVVHVSLDSVYSGYIEIADEIKKGAKEAIARLRDSGVKHIVMLTGDGAEQASAVAGKVGIDTFYASLLPHEKVEKVEELTRSLPPKGRLAFVGDGVNDAPVLMRSDIGISMGALGSDAAIEAADIVLMDDKVEGVSTALTIARHTRSVVIQNITIALLVKIAFLSLGAFGVATMWEAVIADVGVSLLAVLNSTRTLRLPRTWK